LNILFDLLKLRESPRINYGECVIIVNDALFVAFSTSSFARQTLIGYYYVPMSANIASTFTTANANFNHYRITLPINNVNANFYMSECVHCRIALIGSLNINEAKVSGNVTRNN